MWYDLDFWPTVSASENAKESKLLASRKQNTLITCEFHSHKLMLFAIKKIYMKYSNKL